MVFAQATVPVDWTLDVTDNDIFLRVVSTAGGATGGPDNDVVSSTDIGHFHDTDHAHPMPHTHPMDHSHSYPGSRTNGMSTLANENNIDYRAKDDVSSTWSTVATLAVGAGTVFEGHHDHVVIGTTLMSLTNSPNTQQPDIAQTGIPVSTTGGQGSNVSLATLVHNHTIAANWRPRYKDIVVGTLN